MAEIMESGSDEYLVFPDVWGMGWTEDGCVYVMTVPSGWTKVGLAKSPADRRKAIQTGNPEEVRLFAATYCLPDDNPNKGKCAEPSAIDLERKLHRRLERRGYDRRGEWFRISGTEAVNAFEELYRG